MVQKKSKKKKKERIPYIDNTEKLVVIAKCVEIIQTCEKGRKHKKCFIPTGDHESCSSHKQKKCCIPICDSKSSCDRKRKHKKCFIPTGDHESCNSHKHKKCCIPICDSESSSDRKHKKCGISIGDNEFFNDFKKKKSKKSINDTESSVRSEISPEDLEPVMNLDKYVSDVHNTTEENTDNIISDAQNLIPHIFPVKKMPKPLVKRVNGYTHLN